MSVLHLAGKMFLLENSTIDTGEVDVGRRVIQEVPPGENKHTHTNPSYLKGLMLENFIFLVIEVNCWNTSFT